MKSKYSLTIKATCVGYILQAIVNNLTPLLFVYFNLEYKIPTYLISIIITYNFALQILVDAFSAKITIKLGYRRVAILSAIFAGLGLIILGLTPYIFKTYMSIYIGIMIAVTFMAIGGGVTEVILSPIIEAIPEEQFKSQRMSLVHSFYCLGHILIVMCAIIFFVSFGIDNWMILSFILTIFPITMICFFIKCPIVAPIGDEKPVGRLKLFKSGTFIILFVLMICAGAQEQSVAQWISFFAEKGLNIDKSLGDLIGGCSFAFCMFASRLYFSKMGKKPNMLNVLLISSILLSFCFVISAITQIKLLSLAILSLSGVFVGIMWPGMYSLSSEIFPRGGTVMFSMLALGGDLGCTLGPTVVGAFAEIGNINVGILSSIIFSLIMIICTIILLKSKRKKEIKIK